MDLSIRSLTSLRAELLDSVSGMAGMESIGLNFGTHADISSAGVVAMFWVPVTGKTLTIDLSADLAVTTDAAFGADVSQLQGFAGGDVAWVQSADYFEVILAADPLAMDAAGNPVAASRASEMTITALGENDVVHCVSTLAVTAAGKVAICRRASRVSGFHHITQLSISGITATPCKLFILFGGGSGA